MQVPVIDIGDRQKGRLRASNIVHAQPTRQAIASAFEHIESASYRAQLPDTENPYGDGRAGERIAQVIASAPQRAELLAKRALPLAGGPLPAFEQLPQA